MSLFPTLTVQGPTSQWLYKAHKAFLDLKKHHGWADEQVRCLHLGKTARKIREAGVKLSKSEGGFFLPPHPGYEVDALMGLIERMTWPVLKAASEAPKGQEQQAVMGITVDPAQVDELRKVLEGLKQRYPFQPAFDAAMEAGQEEMPADAAMIWEMADSISRLLAL